MRTFANNDAAVIDPLDGKDQVALTLQRLAELDRLRDFAFVQLNRINETTLAMPSDQLLVRMFGPKGTMAEYDRFSRAVRQITVLEFELRGLFWAPDRNSPRKPRLVKSDRPGFVPPKNLPNPFIGFDMDNPFDIRPDYRTGPLDEVVAGIRKTLGAEAPANDPFAPPAERQPAPEPAVKAPPKGPEYYMRTRPAEPAPKPAPAYVEHAQNDPAMKAALMAIRNLDNKGFRQPSKAKIRKRQLSRGPPK